MSDSYWSSSWLFTFLSLRAICLSINGAFNSKEKVLDLLFPTFQEWPQIRQISHHQHPIFGSLGLSQARFCVQDMTKKWVIRWDRALSYLSFTAVLHTWILPFHWNLEVEWLVAQTLQAVSLESRVWIGQKWDRSPFKSTIEVLHLSFSFNKSRQIPCTLKSFQVEY